MSIPHLFRCPISLDLFTDPVTLSTGQTYDRPSIEKWLADGNLTCPVTMQRLHDTTLVPNHTLRHLIDQWLLAGPDLSSRQKPTKPIADCGLSLSALKHNLQSPSAARAAKLEALEKVRVLSVESDIGQACLIQLGFFPLLLQLLFQAPRRGDSELMQLALDCVLTLSPSTQLDSLNMLKNEIHLASLVALLDQGNPKIKTGLCHLLEAIAASPVTQELCVIMGQTRRVLQVLVSLLRDKSDARAAEAAARAISAICSLEANRGNAIKEGVVDGLIAYLSLNSAQRSASRALAALELLLGLEAGKKAAMEDLNAVQVLVKLVFRVSSDQEGSEHAVGSLLILCCDSARVRMEAVNAGVLVQLLLLLQAQCSSRAKTEARALLKLLRSMWSEDTGGRNFHNAV
ncbi:U-box domain-containing protein 26-like [Phoenix dactylifera]|uniref:U-box domain-containing protein n=1 Tax=Phoenix dactylifera TaxID=42345 RepID=A0A8B7CXX0_PHODC|nr:U-box domain-containing protein 26-like [Phoenix dactylifera]